MHEQLQHMQVQLDALLKARYGVKSECIHPGQLQLFAEEEVAETPTQQLPPQSSAAEQAPKGHGRRRPSRDLPRDQRYYDVPEGELCCPTCNEEREIIGKESSEQYDYTPSSVRVIEHIQLKRACRNCRQHVVLAEKPAAVIEKGLAAPGMLAYIATSKFEDHLPLHRLERIFRREGALIARSTMCDWLAATANCLTPVYERMCRRIRQSNVIWTDDTPVKMLDREDPRNMRTARLWVYLGDRQNPFTVFDFTESRRRDGPQNFLGDFSGYLQADAFAGYDLLPQRCPSSVLQIKRRIA